MPLELLMASNVSSFSSKNNEEIEISVDVMDPFDLPPKLDDDAGE